MVTQFLKWIGKTFATVAVTVIVTLWLTGLIMTSVIQSVLEEYEIPLQVEPTIYTGVLGYLWGFKEENKGSASEIAGKIDETDSEAAVQEKDQISQQFATEQEQINDNPAVEALAPIELEEKVEISKDELGIKKQALTDQEKERLLQIVVEKIPADQWQTISLYIEDGLSEKELLNTQQILSQHLNDEEYKELMAILKKS